MPGTAPASRFVQHIEALINGSPKTQRQIAIELGYGKPNMITMIKQGATRLPVGKVAALAEATDGDPVELLRLWLDEYEPDLLAAIERYQRLLLTERERALVMALRRRSDGRSPAQAATVPAPGPSLRTEP